MADEVNKDEKVIKEGYTEFGGSPMRGSWFFYPVGRLGRFFSKFFATKAQPEIVRQFGDDPDTYEKPISGDTVVAHDVIKLDRPSNDPASFSVSRGSLPVIPEIEVNRKRRYKEYELMDEYPEVGAAFDIYADDSTQKNIEGDRWEIITDDELIKKEVENLFDTIKFDRFYWDIIRNTVKYGDCFIELIVDLDNAKAGVNRIKILNPNYILRVENEYGYLTDFLQEIPQKNDWDSYGVQGEFMKGKQYIELDKNQIVHFRLHSSDPLFYPYGKSIAALSRQIFRSLKLMEDAMLIYRLMRAPERRIFYVDVGQLPSSKAEMFIERLKDKFKKEKFFDRNTGQIDARYNPLSADEDFFVPTRGGNGTKIDTLPGAQNLGEVDDVKYFRDKLLASLKIPKDYIVEKEQSPERKANLSQLDVKFARTIARIQHSIEVALESIAKRHLKIKGFPDNLIRTLRMQLPDPSDMFTKRRLDIDALKATVVGQVLQLQLFPKSKIYKDYYNLNDKEIEEIEKELKEEMEEMMEQQMQQQQAMMPPDMGAGAPPMGGAPMGAPLPPEGAAPPPGAGMEDDENIPPTAEGEISRLNTLKALRTKLIVDNRNGEVAKVTRMILREENKIKN